jgi:hypothetical protein
MKREDFTIDGIPEGYIVYDVDLTPSGQPVAGVAHPTNQSLPAFILTASCRIELPEQSLWPYGNRMLKPRIRAAGEQAVVAQRARTRTDDPTVWIWNHDGHEIASFNAGDDCEELLANEEVLILFYGDEGGGGAKVYSTTGDHLWNQAEEFPEAMIYLWFHAAAWSADGEAAVWADLIDRPVDNECTFIRLNVRQREQETIDPPAGWSFPKAITLAHGRVFVHGARTLDRDVPRDAADFLRVTEDQIISWKPGTIDWEVVGSYEGYLRGLPGGRFISPKPDGYTILSFD